MAKKNKKKRIYLIGGGILLLVIIIAVFSRGKGEEVNVSVVSAEKKTIVEKVSESGVLKPVIEVPIAPDVSGEIIQLNVYEGQKVKAGDLLAIIKPDNYQSALAQVIASLNSSKADYAQALANIKQMEANVLQDSINYARNKTLYAKKAIPLTELQATEFKYKISLANLDAAKQSAQASYYRIKSAQASVKQAQENLNQTNIYASMDGTITELQVEKGQRVVGTATMAGTEMMKIADLSRMEVVVDINENDIVNVHIGDSAKIEVDAFPGKTFYGKVTQIAYAAKNDNIGTTDQITNFEVKVEISAESYKFTKASSEKMPQSTLLFRPGMTSLVDIFTNKKENVISVPIQSVTVDKSLKDNDKQQEIVYLYNDGKVKKVNVKTGISDDENIEILSGLKKGQKLVSGPYRAISKLLKDGMEVGLEKEKDGFEEQ